MRALLVAVVLLAGCGPDDVAPGSDLAVDVRDLAVVDLAPSGCPASAHSLVGGCRGDAICRYPTDAGPNDHLSCISGHWQYGNCPWGPSSPPSTFENCTGYCTEWYGEAYTSCSCLPNGIGVCCTDTGGTPACGNYDAGP